MEDLIEILESNKFPDNTLLLIAKTYKSVFSDFYLKHKGQGIEQYNAEGYITNSLFLIEVFSKLGLLKYAETFMMENDELSSLSSSVVAVLGLLKENAKVNNSKGISKNLENVIIDVYNLM